MEFLDYENKSVWMDSNGLQSMRSSDKVKSINDKPSVDAEGLLEQKPDLRKSVTENTNNLSISEPPNLYKQIGVCMSNSSSFFKFPHFLFDDPRYQDARNAYQKVLLFILRNAAYSETYYSIGAEKIKIESGQFCVSIRGLMDLCNQGVRRKEDLISKNSVDRAITYFEKCQFVRQEVRHGKSIITVTLPGFYEKNKSITGTTSETNVGLTWDIKEEDKEYIDSKEEYIPKKQDSFEPSSFATALLSEFSDSLFSSIPDYPKAAFKKTKTQYEAAERIGKKTNYDMEVIRKIIKFAHRPGEFWLAHVHSLSYLERKLPTLKEQMKNNFKTSVGDKKQKSVPESLKIDNSELKIRLEKGGIPVPRAYYELVVKKADAENRPEDKRGYILNDDITRTIT